MPPNSQPIKQPELKRKLGLQHRAQRRQFEQLPFALALAMFLSSSPAALPTLANDNDSTIHASIGSSIHLKGGVGKFEVLSDDVQRQLGIKCGNSGAGGTTIADIRSASPADNNGLRVGDEIASATLNGTRLELGILDSTGKTRNYRFNVKADQGSFKALLPRPDPRAYQQPFALSSFQNQSRYASAREAQSDKSQQTRLFGEIKELARFLSNYDIELIVDKSLSMRRRDCPGMMSRWEWCASQSQELGQQLAPFAPQGITIVPFARFYDVYERENPEQIANLFYTTKLQQGTRLAEPLQDRLNQSLRRRASGSKPTIIAIITDGVPVPRYEPQAVIDVLIDASNRMKNPKDIAVVFFQIGGRDPFGERYVYQLDNYLVSWGARFDYVQSVPFEQLQEQGLARCLVAALRGLGAKATR